MEQDRNTGLVRGAIEWHDPVVASHWVNDLISSLNREIKAADVEEANNSITYLQQQLANTQLVEMQRVFYQLIESQTRVTMLADVRDEYVFQVIDPAVVPDQRIAPRRSLIAIIGTMAGFFFVIVFIFITQMIQSKNE